MTREAATPGADASASRAPRISIIVAMAKNRVIGDANRIPWHLPAELKLFKSITMGHHIVMGRNTWESIGRPLPGRVSVVVTRNADFRADGAQVVHSFNAALAACAGDDEVFVIGGAQLYAAALPRADRLYLTVVEAEVPGDTRMPAFDFGAWRQVSVLRHAADDKNPYDYAQTVYERANAADA